MKSYRAFLNITIVLAIVLVMLVALPVSTARAATRGSNNAGLGTNGVGVGTAVWSDPNNITLPTGDTPASVILKKANRISNYLWGTHYGFNLPLNATILGIEVVINRQSSAHNPSILDSIVSLVTDSGTVGQNKASGVTWPLSMGTATYGEPTDLWGTTWTPAAINSVNFGVALSAERQNNGNNDRTASVDYMQITVYYSSGTTLSVTALTGTYGNTVSLEATLSPAVSGKSISFTLDGVAACTGFTDASGYVTCNTRLLTNVGTYPTGVGASFAGDLDYGASSGTANLTVNKANATCTVTPYNVTYDAAPHTATGACTGVLDETLEGLDLTGTTHTNADLYEGDPWTFTDVTGNYIDDSGTVDDNIDKANVICVVTPYKLEYDRLAHTATGTCTGAKGEVLLGLNLTGTTHTDIGTYPDDPWAFTDVTGNYNNNSGTVTDEITLRFVTVAADAKSKVYGQPDPELTYHVTVGSLLSGDAFSGALTRQPGENVGTYAILQGTLSLPDYYNLTFEKSNLTISGSLMYFLPYIDRRQ